MDDLVFAGSKSQDVFIVTSSQTTTILPVIVELSRKSKKKPVFTTALAGNRITPQRCHQHDGDHGHHRRSRLNDFGPLG
jgi:hypothetical protein